MSCPPVLRGQVRISLSLFQSKSFPQRLGDLLKRGSEPDRPGDRCVVSVKLAMSPVLVLVLVLAKLADVEANSSCMHRPSSLVTRHLHIATVVLVLVLDRRDAVHRGRVLELDLLGGAGRGALLGVLLEDALGRARVGVCVTRLQRRILPRVGCWADGRRRHRRPGHGARGARRAERQRRTRGVLSGRDAQREFGPGSSCGVHFRM